MHNSTKSSSSSSVSSSALNPTTDSSSPLITKIMLKNIKIKPEKDEEEEDDETSALAVEEDIDESESPIASSTTANNNNPATKPKQKRKPRKLIPLKTKEAIIADCEIALLNNTSFRAVADKWEVNPQSVSHIWKHRNEIRNHLQSHPESVRKNIICKRTPSLHIVEHLLINWIDEQISKSISISKYSLCNQAKLWVEHFDEVLGVETPTHFQSSHGWTRNFFKRFGLSNISELEVPTRKINDIDSVGEFVAKLEKIIDDGQYRPEHIFNLDECGVNWRFLPTNKAPKEHFTLLIGTNAAGDYKIKPILIHNRETPNALLHINKMTLPVTYRHHKSMCMTAEMLDNWFRRIFLSQVRLYHKSKDIDHKILLLVDSVPVHRKLRDLESKKLKIVFIPPTVAHQVQPCVQSVSNAIQVNYVRRLIKQAQETKVTNMEDPKEQLKEFWKDYNIRKAIDDLSKVWQEDVTYSTIIRSWQKIYPKNPRKPSELELPPYIRGPLADYFRPLLEPVMEDLVDFDGLKRELLDEILAEVNIGLIVVPEKKSQPKDSHQPSNGTSSIPSAHSAYNHHHHHHNSDATATVKIKTNKANANSHQHCSTTAAVDLSPSDVLLENPDIGVSIQRLIGSDRYHLLMQVLSLPTKQVKLAQQLMILMATDSNGKSIRIKRTAQTEKLCAKLREAYLRHKEVDDKPTTPSQQPPPPPSDCNIN